MMYKYYKYFDKNVFDLKRSMNCYNLFEHRFIESILFRYNDFFFFSLGFKYILEIKKYYSCNNHVLINNLSSNDSYSYINFDLIMIKQNIFRYNKLSILNKVFHYGCFIVGRFLNTLENGFSIGIFGLVAFILKKSFLHNKSTLTSIYIINKIDFLSKRFLLSQKLVKKLTYRALFKLSSLIMYINNN